MFRSATLITPPRRQTPWVIAAHWTTVLLVAIGAAALLVRSGVDDRALRLGLLQLHRSSGLTVLALTLLRASVSPWVKVSLGDSSRWQRAAASLSHVLLYGLLIVIPLIGWALSSARGQPVYLLGVVPMPALLGRDRDLAEQLYDLHQALAIGLLCLVLLHSAAALWHHYIRRDAVLRGMLPRRADAALAHSKTV